MTTLTVADFAVTGQWLLIVNIYATGMEAFLENTLHADLEPQLLFSTTWEDEPETLLRRIENAVYDNPRVLDDFSARIILFDRRTLFIPTALAEETEGYEEMVYSSLYNAEESDVVVETDGDLTAASSMAPGLKDFVMRTFPGARVASNLMYQVSSMRRTGEGKRMNVTRRGNEADFILLDGRDLISASTHPCATDDDVSYHLYNILSAYGIDRGDVAISDEYKLA